MESIHKIEIVEGLEERLTFDLVSDGILNLKSVQKF